jgi:hypothetical protein
VRDYGDEYVAFDTWACDTHLLNGLVLRVFRHFEAHPSVGTEGDLNGARCLGDASEGATPLDIERAIAGLRRIGLIPPTRG